MGKDSITNKIKRNILKLIFCNQRNFKIKDMCFYGGKPTTVKNSIIAFNENYILKLEIYKHRLKANSVRDEAKILKHLKENGAICQPIIHSYGEDFLKRPYIIMERVENKEGAHLADVLLAILEQQKLGVFHRDTKTDNIVFNGLIAKIIDYDQAQIIEEIKAYKPKESIIFFINKLEHFWKFKNMMLDIGEGIEEVTNNCLACFSGEGFDFSKTNLYKSFNKLPFYALDESEIKSNGVINLKNWEKALNKIDFISDEKVLDINPDTGALSRYLNKRGCNVSIYSAFEREIYATKIISNILGINIKIANNLEEEFGTIFLLNNNEKTDLTIFKCAKRIITRVKNNENCTQKIPENFKKSETITLDDYSHLIVFKNKEDI